jgi:hypothetical protein
MKTLNIIIITLFLYGNLGGFEWEIAKRYENVITKDLKIEIKDRFDCGWVKNAGGCHWRNYDNTTKVIWVRSGMTPWQFEYALLHEIGHSYVGSSEFLADRFARSMMKNYYREF